MAETMNSAKTPKAPKVSDKKALLSKIKGIRSHQEALIQKKLRIDLEIKRTQARYRKLKNLLQNMNESSELPENLQLLLENSDPLTTLRFFQEASTDDRISLEFEIEIHAAEANEKLYGEIEKHLFAPDIG